MGELAEEIEAWASYWGQPLLLAAPIRLAERLLDRGYTKTDDGAEAPGQSSGGSSPGSVPEASEVVSGPAPSSPFPRTFLLWRHVDISGVSGTGPVAEGCQFVDGSVALRWRGDNPATAVWPDLDSMLAVHGHQGATEIQWIDETPIPLWPAEGGLQ